MVSFCCWPFSANISWTLLNGICVNWLNGHGSLASTEVRYSSCSCCCGRCYWYTILRTLHKKGKRKIKNCIFISIKRFHWFSHHFQFKSEWLEFSTKAILKQMRKYSRNNWKSDDSHKIIVNEMNVVQQ